MAWKRMVTGLLSAVLRGAAVLVLGGAAAAQDCPSADEIRAALRVTEVDGTLVVGEASPHGKVMMRLAAFAASPQLVDETRISNPVEFAQALAQDILRPGTPAREAFIPNGQFRGATPEERAATQAAFVAACRESMIALAPKAPFRLMIADQGPLGFYIERESAVQIPRGPNYLRNTHYSDFLVPKGTDDLVETGRYWPMSKAEADALYARLEASAPWGKGRIVQAVAVVEVSEIHPDLRTATVNFVEFALFNHDFSERLHDYGITAAAVPDAPDAPAAPVVADAPQAALLQEGRYATAAEARSRVLELCEGHRDTASRLKCGCVADKAALAWDAQPDLHVYTLLNRAVADSEFDCANPEGRYEAAFDLCRRVHGRDEFVLRLGVEKACHCMAERGTEVGGARAFAYCSTVDDYASRPVAPQVPVSNPVAEGCEAVGAVCSDGTILAGPSPDDGKPMYVAAADGAGYDAGSSGWGPTYQDVGIALCETPEARGGSCATGKANAAFIAGLNAKLKEFNGNYDEYKAVMHCENLVAHEHDDWYLPARDEMESILKGAGSNPDHGLLGGSFYTSSLVTPYHIWVVGLDAGSGVWMMGLGAGENRVRCVRTP